MSTAIARTYAAGCLMALAGSAVAIEAYGYGLGTTDRIGPGFYPTCLGVMLAFVGILIGLFPDQDDDHETDESGWAGWRGKGCIVLGILLFIVLGDRFGLGPATFACVFVSALGSRETTWPAAGALALAATIVAALVFSLLLKFQLPLLHW